MDYRHFKTLSLLSDLLFVFGMGWGFISFFAIGIDPAYPDSRRKGSIYAIVAWSIVGASVIPEIIIDLTLGVSSSTTTQFHGRYGPRRIVALNWSQTLTFSAGVVTMGMSMK